MPPTRKIEMNPHDPSAAFVAQCLDRVDGDVQLLAQRSEVGWRTIYRGRRHGLPRLATLLALARAVGCEVRIELVEVANQRKGKARCWRTGKLHPA